MSRSSAPDCLWHLPVTITCDRLPMTSACDNYLWQLAWSGQKCKQTSGQAWALETARPEQQDHSVHAPNQWDCNVISHWLGTYTEWSLNRHPIWCELGLNMILLIHFRSSKTTDIESVLSIMDPEPVNSSFPRPNGRHFAENIFRCIFANEKFCILIKFSLKFVPKGQIDNNSALV